MCPTLQHTPSATQLYTMMQNYMIGLAAVALSCNNQTTTLPLSANGTNVLNPKLLVLSLPADNSTLSACTPADGDPFTEADFTKAVTALGKADAASKASAFVGSLKDAAICSKQEAAMFLAHVWHQSGGLQFKEELACKDTEASKTACDVAYPLTQGKGVSGKHYYGRGYMQLAHDYNYEKAGQDLFGDASKLLNDPDSVASDESLSWRTAAWYWKANVHSVSGVKEGKFGVTTKAINGALECSPSAKPEARAAAQNRFKYYSTIMAAVLPTASAKLDETGCYN